MRQYSFDSPEDLLKRIRREHNEAMMRRDELKKTAKAPGRSPAYTEARGEATALSRVEKYVHSFIQQYECINRDAKVTAESLGLEAIEAVAAGELAK